MSTARRDFLAGIEKAVQESWERNHLHEFDAPLADQERPPKFLTTFPYPYMNGRLHLGHAFSLTKSEFISRYYRMKGYRSLWPFGLHATGTPIAACAQKIAKEIELYGNPPVFPEPEQNKRPVEMKDGFEGAKFKSKRAKTAPPKWQWTIMQSMGIPDSEIAKFADPKHWLDYFPALAIEDLRRFGCHIDFRRSFITTSKNPYYDRFVTWQFHKLHDAGLLKFGKRYCVYSPLDKQPCADHDRASGEGVVEQEYTLVKLTVKEPLQQNAFRDFQELIGERAVVLLAATLRAETTVGQTNSWVNPKLVYHAYLLKNKSGGEEVALMLARAARNLAYQDFSVSGTMWETPKALFEVQGSELIGLPISAPLTKYPTIYVLPMCSIMESKGTGIVMSVPSDSPDDYVTYSSLIQNNHYRKIMNVKDEWIMFFPPIQIIQVPNMGKECAKHICDKMDLRLNDPKLEEAKRTCYLTSFREGVMLEGPFRSLSCAKAKEQTLALLEKNDWAIRYYEPAQTVVSRSGEECVVALCDQWYIEYGKPEWRKAVVEHLNEMNLFSPGLRNGFTEVLNWLSEWPCSRTFGLGTQLPCDRTGTMMIDSLSDSTIYMAYYTISRFVQVGADGNLCLSGAQDNSYGLKPEMFTDAIFDYIFHGSGEPEALARSVGMPLESLQLMRNEFDYFYPVDIRCSAKDLIQNHLTMFLYTHAAIWPNERARWPRAIYCNGHVQVDNEKMAKSLGNFISLSEAIEMYGADATRLTCAESGDTLDDANFTRDTANGFVLKLTTLMDQAKDMLNRKDLRTGEFSIFDKIFENTMNTTIILTERAYQAMQFRVVLNTAYHEFINDFNQYKLACAEAMPHQDLTQRFYEVLTLLLTPLAPHFCEYMWGSILGKPATVINASYPTPTGPTDYALSVTGRVIQNLIKELRSELGGRMRNKVVESVIILTSPNYSDLQVETLKVITQMYRENHNSFPAQFPRCILNANPGWPDRHLIQETLEFAAFVRSNVEEFGEVVLNPEPAVNDYELFSGLKDYIMKMCHVPDLKVKLASDCEDETGRVKPSYYGARPGVPKLAFRYKK